MSEIKKVLEFLLNIPVGSSNVIELVSKVSSKAGVSDEELENFFNLSFTLSDTKIFDCEST